MKLKEQIDEFLIAFSDNDFFDKHRDDFLDISFILDWSEETQIAFMAAEIIHNESKSQVKYDRLSTQQAHTDTPHDAFDKYKFCDNSSMQYVHTGMAKAPACLKYPQNPDYISKKVIPFQDLF